MEKGFAGKEREKFERARERAIGLNFYAYIQPLETIIEKLKEIERLDEEFMENEGRETYF